MKLQFGHRRATYINIAEEINGKRGPLSTEECRVFEDLDLIYRSTCALLYNYVPTSGHPGGSVSSGRFVAELLFDALDYDLCDPVRQEADIISYAAGHKALGLYTMWAIRDEIASQGCPELLPTNDRDRLRLEDLLGFRRNPVNRTPLFQRFNVKPLDGHPTPATPFVWLATGASGVGVSTSLGLALGAADYFSDDPPKVHIVEGEGGLTPGRVSEALACAGTTSLNNVYLHIDWNQASIDSNHVCRDGDHAGEYVQWDPMELATLHDWNVIYVPDGTDLQQIVAAQRRALELDTGQPTALVYRTTKGWNYGIEGKASHGAGHKLCSGGFYEALEPLMSQLDVSLPTCNASSTSCRDGADGVMLEQCFWEALQVVRKVIAQKSSMVETLAGRLRNSRKHLDDRQRKPRAQAPNVDKIYEIAQQSKDALPETLTIEPGTSTTLREQLGRVLHYLNQSSGGAIYAAAADLLNSTSIAATGKGFPEGFYNCKTNPGARLLSIGGICEDAMCGVLAGLSTYGQHIGAGASYGAFIAPLGHIASRLHAIGSQARKATRNQAYAPYILVCGHAGLKTGEDGPTHADPQPLQLLQENFPRGTMITLTPWEPQEIWTLFANALHHRPAVIAPYVTRPKELVLDREALGLAPASAASTGVYRLHEANGDGDGVIVLQGSGVTYAFIQDALPLLEQEGVDLHIYYIASAELFDLLPQETQRRIFPHEHAHRAMGITGFTLPTMYRWITSPTGRDMSLHPFKHTHYLGSGQADRVLEEAGLDGINQFNAIMNYLETCRSDIDTVSTAR